MNNNTYNLTVINDHGGEEQFTLDDTNNININEGFLCVSTFTTPERIVMIPVDGIMRIEVEEVVETDDLI